MNEQIDNSTQFDYSPFDAQSSVAAIPVAADRLYQLAALTVGLFLLVTLL